jgi:hypothetical protein
MALDIADKLKNWAAHAKMGERRVLLEARREILNCRAVLTKIGYGPPNEGEPIDLLNQFVDMARDTLPRQEMNQ